MRYCVYRRPFRYASRATLQVVLMPMGVGGVNAMPMAIHHYTMAGGL